MASKFEIESIFKAVDKMTAPISKMQRGVRKFTRSIERGFRRADKVLSRFATKMGRNLKRGAIVLAAAVTGVGVAIKDLADRADFLSKQAKILDLPIEDLQKLEFVAEQSGLASGELTKALGMLDFQVGQLSAGTGTLITLFKKTDPQFLKTLKGAKNTAQAFGLIIKKLRGMKKATDRVTLARAIFGRQGLKIIRIAQTSAKEIEKLNAEAKRNGLITQKQAAAAEAFNDQVNSLKWTLRGMLQDALMPLMPILTKYLKAMQDWILANRELIKTKIQEFVQGLGKAIAFLVKHGKTIVEVTAGFLGLIAVLRTFIVVMTAVDIALSANPISLMVIAIGFLVGALALAITHMKQFLNLLSRMIGPLGDFVKIGLNLKKLFSHQLPMMTLAPNPVFGAPTFSDLSGLNPQMVSPQSRVAASLNETRTVNTSEVTIRDETGRATVTKGKLGTGVKLQSSGGF